MSARKVEDLESYLQRLAQKQGMDGGNLPLTKGVPSQAITASSHIDIT